MKKQSTLYFIISLVFISLLISVKPAISQKKSNAEILFTDSKGQKLFSYNTTDKIFIKLIYPAKNIDPAKKDIQSAIIVSEIEPNGEVITLTETSATSGIFTGSINVRVSPMPFPKSSFLEVGKGDKLMAKYHLPQNEKGYEELIFDNAYFQGPDWTFFNTGVNHQVLIIDSVNITIDGVPVEKGVFISAFYKKNVNGKVVLKNAGGTGRGVAPGGVRWNGNGHTAIALWGTQEGKNNGFAEGENISWKVWIPKDGKAYDAVATYILDDSRLTHGDTYTKDGISGIKALTITTKK